MGRTLQENLVLGVIWSGELGWMSKLGEEND